MLPPLLVAIASELDLSVAVAGQLATATFAAWAVSLVMAGPLSDSFGRRPVILGGLLLLVVAVIASGFAPNLEMFVLLRILTGLAAGTLPPTSVGVLSDVISPERRAQAVSALLSIGVVTSAVSVPVALQLADWQGWRFAFIVAGLLLVTGLLLNWIWFPRDSRERVRNWAFFSRYWSLVTLRYFQAAVTVGMSQRIAFWTMISYFPAYLIGTYGLSAKFAALPLGIVALGQALGSFSGGPAATKSYRAAIIGVTSAAGGVCAFLCFNVELDLWLVVAIATVGGALLSLAMPALVVASTEYSGDSKSTGASIMGLSNQSGGVLGAAIAGLLLASTGYGGVGYMCLAVTIFSAVMAFLLGRHLRRGSG
jgi:predicted MFS family arabinose efflux permease